VRRGAVAGALLLAALVGLACSPGDSDGSPDSEGDEGSTRTASAGGINVEAIWLGSSDQLGDDLEAYPLGNFLLLEVSLDTHSGDLGSVDLVEAAKLYTGAGSLEPEAWVASSDESHHRSGVLVFPREEFAGSVALSVALGEEKVELVWERIPGS
jgi:hypothetical protein